MKNHCMVFVETMEILIAIELSFVIRDGFIVEI